MPVDITTSVEAAATQLASALAPIVVVPVHDDIVRCCEALFRHTLPSTAVLVVDDASTDPRIVGLLTDMAEHVDHQVVILRFDQPRGFVGVCNSAFAATSPHDVVLVNGDVVVGPEWLERLRAAAASSDTIATASTLTNSGPILSVSDRSRPVVELPVGVGVDEAARRVAAHSQQLRPTIPTGTGHCFYVKRSVLDLLGGFDPLFAPGAGAEVDFSQRAVLRGFRHVCADDVFTFRQGSSSSNADERSRLRSDHLRLVEERYPYFARWVSSAATDTDSPLADALATARRALFGSLVVGVDAPLRSSEFLGTHRDLLEMTRALARHPAITGVRVFVRSTFPETARAFLDGAANVELHVVHDLGVPASPMVDVMYRPLQVMDDAELRWLRASGCRLVVRQLDLIAFNNPGYFDRVEDWIGYRDLVRRTGELADGLTFLSAHAASEGRAAGIVAPGLSTRVVPCGTDHVTDRPDEQPPRTDPQLAPGFVLCLGSAYAHKNRPFAIEVWRELRRRGWEGQLVLAGPVPPVGTSRADELCALQDGDASHVVVIDRVSEQEKSWLYHHAGLVLYPTSVEGFGLVPFEAASLDTPALSTRQGGLDEFLPAGIPSIDGWDVGQSADAAWELLTDDDAATALCRAVATAAAELTWRRSADELVALMLEVLRQPSRRAMPAVSGPTGGGDREPVRGWGGRLVGRSVGHLARLRSLRRVRSR